VPIRKYVTKLTDTQWADCVECAKQRKFNLTQNQTSINRAAVINDPTKDLQGVITECAVAKFFDVPYRYQTIYEKNICDIAIGVEVRSSLHANGHLIVYTYDKLAPYVLTIPNIDKHQITLIGWRDLADCQLDKYWRTEPKVRKESWWIPQSDLHDMATLKERLAA
jgi:hypothetical protein